MTKSTAHLGICAVFGSSFFVLLLLGLAGIYTIRRTDMYSALYI